MIGRRHTGTRPTVLVAGAFGQRNPGDEALLAAFLRALGDVDVTVASADPEQTAAEHGVRAISSSSKRALQYAVNRSSALVFAGGTIFKTLPASTGRPPLSLLRNALAISSYARLRGCSVLMVGVGAGTLPAGPARMLTRRLVRRADLLIMRDDASAQALIGCGVPPPVRVGSDAAWSLVDEPATEHSRSQGVIVVPSRWAGGPALRADLATALSGLQETGLDVRLDPWQVDGTGDDDLAFARNLAGALPRPVAISEPPRDLDEAIHDLQGAALVVTMRFHAQVAAAAAGAPSLSLVHEAKQASLADRLGQPSTAATTSAASMAAAITSALDHPPPAPAAVKSEITSAHCGFDLLRLMTGPSGPSLESIGGLRLEPTA
jgi:polysaccharide pyruvyl transferase WcaK-like protein